MIIIGEIIIVENVQNLKERKHLVPPARVFTGFLNKLKDCENETDVKCKVLEWLSRPAYKTEPYNTKRSNDEFRRFILGGVNQFLETDFTEKDMEQIYTYLGNRCNHAKTLKFIESGYDMSVLKD